MDSPEVVYSYTDGQACEDGVLVPLTGNDRVTCAVFDTMAEHSDPGTAYTFAKFWLSVHGNYARKVYDENIGGGVWIGALKNDKSLEIHCWQSGKDLPVGFSTVWILPNELGGMTLMFPSDY